MEEGGAVQVSVDRGWDGVGGVRLRLEMRLWVVGQLLLFGLFRRCILRLRAGAASGTNGA